MSIQELAKQLSASKTAWTLLKEKNRKGGCIS